MADDDSIPQLVGESFPVLDEVILEEPPKLEDSPPEQLEMLKVLDQVKTAEHPHADPDALNAAVVDTGPADPPGLIAEDKLLELLAMTKTVLETHAAMGRILSLAEEDHRKIHGLESRIKELEKRNHNLVGLLSRKQDKPIIEGQKDESTDQLNAEPRFPTDAE